MARNWAAVLESCLSHTEGCPTQTRLLETDTQHMSRTVTPDTSWEKSPYTIFSETAARQIRHSPTECPSAEDKGSARETDSLDLGPAYCGAQACL